VLKAVMLVEVPSIGGAAAGREVSGTATDEAVRRHSAWPGEQEEEDVADSDRVFWSRRRLGVQCVDLRVRTEMQG
jgi:hypothetical protein